MKNQLSLVIVAGVFTIFGSILNGIFSHDGIIVFTRFFKSTQVLKCSGSAKEIELSKFGLSGFSNRKPKISFDFKNIRIEIRGKEASMSGSISTHHRDGSTVDGKISASGRMIDGFIYFNYRVEETDQGGGKWNGVGVVRKSKKGDWFGYWITEDIYQDYKGDFIMGEVKFSPQ